MPQPSQLNPLRILIINPNTSESMTAALREPVETLGYTNTEYTFYTSPPHPSHPTGLASINSPADASLSSTHALPSIIPLLPDHDAFLIACYSPHPLVVALRALTRKPVMGILEASIDSAVQLLRTYRLGQGVDFSEKFSIITTGSLWVEVFKDGMDEIIGWHTRHRFCDRVEAIGLNAGELHSSITVEEKVRAAVRELESDIGVVILGCAGMVGMEAWVRDEFRRMERKGEEVRVVDGVKAGVGILQGLARGGF